MFTRILGGTLERPNSDGEEDHSSALEVPDATERIPDGDELAVDPEAGTVTNETTGEEPTADGLPPFVREIVEAGGLIEYGKRIEEQTDF